MVSVNQVRPPGSILTSMYVKERLKRYIPGKFIEVGPGCSGEMSRILLELGWTGTAYELGQDSVSILNCKFQESIKNKKFRVKNLDWLKVDEFENVDLIVSCNVIEHLSSDEEQKFIDKSYSLLNKNGLLIAVVPSSEKHWGIEDDIAGHFRRYSEKMVIKLFDDQKWKIMNIQGLTFPVSNILLPISNFLVKKHEKSKLNLSPIERTKHSGNRNVFMKTRFPGFLKFILNEKILYPLHILQKMFNYKNSLTLYFEIKKSHYS